MADTVKLDVGGHVYTTTRSTLTRYPDSMLGAMFSGRFPSNCDASGAYTIDGDGPIFRHILNFLRRSKLSLPDDFKEWDLLANEADFYQLKELMDAVTSLKQEREKASMKAIQKMEFVEFIEREQANTLSYRGSLETFDRLPEDFRILFILDTMEHLIPYNSILPLYGEITASYADKIEKGGIIKVLVEPQRKRPNFMKILSHMSELGFEFQGTSGNSAEKSWLFARSI